MLAFADHHVFTKRDVQRILKMAEGYDWVVTTEKDYMRMLQTPLVEQLGDKLKLISIKTDFGGDKETFERGIMLYVAENNRKTTKMK
jgi:tetraacyldisaccharide-1-P 4'-kinase